MTGLHEQRPDSDVERELWFAGLEPNQPDLNFEDFKIGLGASEEIFATIQELVTQTYDNHGLDNETLLPGGPGFSDAVTEATSALEAIFETVPTQWLKIWCEALILHIRDTNRAKKEAIREGKKPSPALAESPTAGADAPRISQGPPPRQSSDSPPTSIESRQPSSQTIEQKIFGLKVFPADEHKLTLFKPSIVEIMAVRCVPKGRDPKLVESYQLSFFIKEFEKLLNAGSRKVPYEFAHGKLVYYCSNNGNDLGIRTGTRRTITSQQEFEAGVAYLLNNGGRDTLTFTFFQETSEDRKRRMSGGRKWMKRSLKGELQKLRHEEVDQQVDPPRKMSYREKMQAAIHPNREDSANNQSKISFGPSDRKATPGQSQIPKKVWGGPYRGKTLPDPSRRKAALGPIHVPQAGSSSKPATNPQDPSPGKLTDPVSKALPPRKVRAELYPDSVNTAPKQNRPARPYPPASPASIDRVPLNPPYGSVLYPGARTPPPLRRKRAIINAVTETIYNGKRLHAVLTGTATKPENAALFSPDPNDRNTDKEEEPRPSTSRTVTPRISQEQRRLRAETGFHPQPPSPAVQRRSTIASKVSAKTSISFPPVANMKNIFKRNSKDATPVDELVDTTEDFYAEVSRKTFTRGGEKEAELSIQRLKDLSHHERMDDSEVEEPEEDDDFENPEEYLVTRLQGFQNMKELCQIRPRIDSARWIDCCRLFDIKPADTGLNSTVELAGLKTHLYQYQAYSVYWQMKTSRTVGGGFVADEPGLGKTLSFLAFVVAERQLSWLWDEVEATREAKGPRHLPKDNQAQGLPCPSSHERPGWIACPCSASSPTSKWAAKKGIRLACVPQSLVTSWISQWNIHIDTADEHLGLRLIVAHDAANPIPAPTFGNADARHARNLNEVRAKRNVFDSKANKYNPESARRHQERYLVLTTPQSYRTWVKRFEYEGFFLSYAKSLDTPTWVKGKSRGIVFGLAMIDECHEEYIKEKGRSGVLSDLALINNPFIWGYSGTPLGSTPRSLEGVLWAVEQHFPRSNPNSKITGWDEDPILSQYHYRALDIICKDFEKHVKNRTGNQLVARKLEDDFTPFLFRFMIRRTADSTWFGRPLIKLKKHIHQEVVLAHNPKFDTKLADLVKVIEDEVHEKYADLIDIWKANDPMYQTVDWPRNLTFNQRCRVEWRLRIIATFPALVPLSSVHHKHHVALTTEEFIERLVLPRDKKNRVSLVCAGLKSRERTATIDAFTDAIDKDTGLRKQKNSIQILIGTTRLIGTGLQLTRAANLVLMEPDYEFYRELQAVARVHRIGQRNLRSYSFRLIDEGSEIENRIVKRQEQRGEVHGRKVQTRLLSEVIAERQQAVMSS
ncbi:hypothetical protein L207DRAFT_599534 [Hyaloscypha variabilis F]|uniref:Helicase C-terminal domain-containing protein n=1 Tax=Hyaloscypha variabilis (strain UAMH 11265 / GT02V1 / F) TaxID=1149755 RepID=A0A2J6RFD4_HYAVF|nr:hypothetical protein L207DRAFT_599534 [Hyaloscypha variabilis F]